MSDHSPCCVATTLEWSEEAPPNKDISYTHVIAETPMGRIVIEWKGWKEYPNFDTNMPWGEYIAYLGFDLESAKEAVQKAWSEMVSKMTGGEGRAECCNAAADEIDRLENKIAVYEKTLNSDALGQRGVTRYCCYECRDGRRCVCGPRAARTALKAATS